MRRLTLILAVVCAAMLPASAQLGNPPLGNLQGLPGDVTLDGKINILDVQRAVNQALQLLQNTPEADINGDGVIDIKDVQNLVNSALGTGGVFQVIEGRIVGLPEGVMAHIEAIATDGLEITVPVGPEGRFRIRLRTGTGWTITIVDADGNVLGTLEFQLGPNVSTTLPLPDISVGNVVDLGDIQLMLRFRVPQDILALLARMRPPLPIADMDGNGIPDYIDHLIQPAMRLVPATLPGDAIRDLLQRIKGCVDANIEALRKPTLIDADQDKVPDFLQPFLQCVREAILAWMRDWDIVVILPILGADANGDGVPDVVDQFIRTCVMNVVQWLQTVIAKPVPVQDLNGNGIPDYIDGLIQPALQRVPPGIARESIDDLLARIKVCVDANIEQLRKPALIDSDRDGVLDFVQPFFQCATDAIVAWINERNIVAVVPELGVDADGNGVPDAVQQFLRGSADAVRRWVSANIGAPEVIDANGNGIPDFIENRVVDPNLPPPPGGVPLPLQDADGDGVPNFLDPDYVGSVDPLGDADGDGIPNAFDRDANGNGIPDYAEVLDTGGANG